MLPSSATHHCLVRGRALADPRWSALGLIPRCGVRVPEPRLSAVDKDEEPAALGSHMNAGVPGFLSSQRGRAAQRGGHISGVQPAGEARPEEQPRLETLRLLHDRYI